MSHDQNNDAVQQDIDPEVVPKAKRRKFSTKYKLPILNEHEACTEHCEKGALLRQKGLYSSHVTTWRR